MWEALLQVEVFSGALECSDLHLTILQIVRACVSRKQSLTIHHENPNVHFRPDQADQWTRSSSAIAHLVPIYWEVRRLSWLVVVRSGINPWHWPLDVAAK
jgi:hypothetical protein